jgi:hypothetical protein
VFDLKKIPQQESGERHKGLRAALRIVQVLLAVAALYMAGVFYARWDENRRLEQRRLEQQRDDARQAFEKMGGDRFEILQFYASPGIVRRGETVELCYGASNAKTVRLEPPPRAVAPSLARCVTVSPERDTSYTLTIEDAHGNTKSQSLLVCVLPD